MYVVMNLSAGDKRDQSYQKKLFYPTLASPLQTLALSRSIALKNNAAIASFAMLAVCPVSVVTIPPALSLILGFLATSLVYASGL
jgi:hypothetical protein